MESSKVTVENLLISLIHELSCKSPFNFKGNIKVEEYLGHCYFNEKYSHTLKEGIFVSVDYEKESILLSLEIGPFFITTGMYLNQKYKGIELPNFGYQYVDFLAKYFLELCNSEEVEVGYYKKRYKQTKINVKEYIYGNRILSKNEKESSKLYEY